MSTVERSFVEALKSRDFSLVELYARAAVAQYVIWIRRHTAPMMHTGGETYEGFVGVDLAALEDHIKRLGAALSTNQHPDDFPAHVQHIRRLVGVRELNVHLVALGAQWLSEKGDEAAAVEELELLGDLEQSKDSLALSLAAQLLDIG